MRLFSARSESISENVRGCGCVSKLGYEAVSDDEGVQEAVYGVNSKRKTALFQKG
jgi:hypothetical protein